MILLQLSLNQHLGYVFRLGASAVTIACQFGNWTPVSLVSPDICTEGVALVTGGKTNSLMSISSKAEAYIHSRSSRLLATSIFDFVEVSAHTLDYVNGILLLCGGRTHADRCMKGVYQASRKGW